MPMTIQELRRLLRTEGLFEAPPGNPERTGQLERRIARRRRRLRGQVAAAAAVLVVAVGSAVAARGLPGGSGGGEPAGPGTATPTPHVTVVSSHAVPIEKLWPQAVTKLPSKLPNGRRYAPEAFVDDHTLLVTTTSGF